MLKSILLNALFPPQCQSCGKLLDWKNAEILCHTCAARIRWIENSCEIGDPGETFHFDKAYACAAYEGPVQNLLKKYKFKQKVSVESFLKNVMERFASARLAEEKFDAIIAVPADPGRGFARGFNPAARLSRGLAKQMNVPDVSRVIGRHAAPCQSLLPKTKRKTNVRDAFYLTKSEFPFKNVLLVDDIMTSGHTLSACARVLKAGGAEKVTALAFARA